MLLVGSLPVYVQSSMIQVEKYSHIQLKTQCNYNLANINIFNAFT